MVLGLVVLGAAAAPAATAQETDASASLHVVTLQPDGSADVTLRMTYDLTTPAEREAFASLENDSETRAAIASAFEERLTVVATAMADRTGRETTVTEASVSVATNDGGDTGVVTLTATWMNLATVEGDRVVLTEPYASGFVADRQFIVQPPAGYAVVETTPQPTAEVEDGVAWAAGTTLDGFRLVAAPADGSGEDGSNAAEGMTGTTGQPGVGPLGALIGFLAGVGLLIRRRI